MTDAEPLAHENDNSGTRTDSLRNWRREKVWELRSMGHSIDEIVSTLKQDRPDVKISHGTVFNDLKAKQAQIQKEFNKYIEEELPIQHHLAITGLDRIIKEAWRIYAHGDSRNELAALNVVSDAIMKKQILLGDPAQIKRAMRAVAYLRSKLEDKAAPKEVAS